MKRFFNSTINLYGGTKTFFRDYAEHSVLSIKLTTVDYALEIISLIWEKYYYELQLDKQLVLSRIAVYLLGYNGERKRKKAWEAIRISFSAVKAWRMAAAKEKLILTWVSFQAYQIDGDKSKFSGGFMVRETYSK